MIPAAFKTFLDRNGLFDKSMTNEHTTVKRCIDDPRSPTFGICRTPVMVESPVLENNILQLSDPRSPTVDILRTPIQIIDNLDTLQLDDPRSPTIGMIRTPIQVSNSAEATEFEQISNCTEATEFEQISNCTEATEFEQISNCTEATEFEQISNSTEVIEFEQTSTPGIAATKKERFIVNRPHASPNIRNRKYPVPSTQDVAKKLLFSVSNPETNNLPDTPVKSRKPLGLVCGNRLQTNSPLHIIRSKQSISVEQAMFKSVVPISQLDLENTPPSRQSVWDGRDSTFRI